MSMPVDPPNRLVQNETIRMEDLERLVSDQQETEAPKEVLYHFDPQAGTVTMHPELVAIVEVAVALVGDDPGIQDFCKKWAEKEDTTENDILRLILTQSLVIEN